MAAAGPAAIAEWRIEGDSFGWLIEHIPFDMRGPGAFTWRRPLP